MVRRLRRTLSWPPFQEVEPGTPPLPSPEEEFAAAHIQPYVPTGDLERVARRVVGVHSCRVLRQGDEPVPEKVRVVCQADRRTKVAKDIQTAWFALWDLYVPRTLFYVTAVRSRLDLLPERRRLQLCRVRFHRREGGQAASVDLFWHGRYYQGRVVSGTRDADPGRLAAEATVAAVREVLPLHAALDLMELRRVQVAGVLALVAAVEARQRLLLGVAQHRGDVREAAARAVLDATNRLLARGGGLGDEGLPDAERGLEDERPEPAPDDVAELTEA